MYKFLDDNGLRYYTEKIRDKMVWEKGPGEHSVQTVGTECVANSDSSVAEGQKSKTGDETIAPETIPIEEQANTTFGPSHAEGFATLAKPLGSHSEGYKAQALGFASHAENNSTQAKGINSHAEGVMSITLPTTGVTARPTWNDAYAAHAEGHITTASGRASHTEGNNTLANNPSEHAEGQYNISNYVDNSQYGNAGNTQHSIGIGTDNLNRKNAFEVMQNGDAYLIGVGDYDGANVSEADTLQEIVNNAIQTETDPTVPAWAKASTKPTYTASEVGLGNVGNFKAVSTVASQGLSSTEQSNARANIGAGTSSFSGNYNDLSNKPTIPTVNNATLTIQRNGTNVATFTANSSTNTTANISVPTTASDIGLGNVGNFKAVSTVANQGLTDTEKTNARANIGAGTSDYSQLSNKPQINSVELSGNKSFDDLGVASKNYVDLRVPTLPTVNGNYILQCTVTGGVPTVQWTVIPFAEGEAF